MRPVVRDDADELIRLDGFIKTLDGNIAVLASSYTINPDILANIGPSLNPLAPLSDSVKIMWLPAVDSRDGLPYGIAGAEYIIVASPVQTHLSPGDQRAVTVPAEMLMGGTGFSSAFEKMGEEFTLNGGVKVYVYRRTRANTEEEMAEVWERIKK